MSVYSEYIGDWWLPENPEKKIHGVLTCRNAKRPIIKLTGSFDKNCVQDEAYDIILGEAYGKKITLLTCCRNNATFSYRNSGYLKSEFSVRTYFVGHHFQKKEDIQFIELSARYSILEDWLGEKLYQFKTEKKEDGTKEHIFKISIPKEKKFILNAFKISIGYNYSHGTQRHGKNKFEYDAIVSVNVIEAIPLEKLFLILYHFKNFLNLATGYKVTLFSLNGITSKLTSTKIFYPENIPSEKVYSEYFPFNYSSISKEPEFYLQNWFNLVERIKPTYELFFGSVYNPELYPTLTFLNYAQAIESYHSRTYSNEGVISDELFNELKSCIKEIIKSKIKKPENRQHFYPQIGHMNQKNLKTRIENLFQKYGKLFDIFISDKDVFTQKVLDTRNFYTHYIEKLEEKASKILELPFLSDKLRFMLFVIFLKEMGFNDEVTMMALRRYINFTAVRNIYY